MAVNEIVAKKLYAGGYVRHSLIGKIKSIWDRGRAASLMDSAQYEVIGFVGPTSTTFSRTLPSAARRARVPPLGPEPWTATASSSPSTRPDRAAFVKINPDGKMTHLGRSTLAPVTFSQEGLTGHFSDLPAGRTYNMVISEERDYATSVARLGIPIRPRIHRPLQPERAPPHSGAPRTMAMSLTRTISCITGTTSGTRATRSVAATTRTRSPSTTWRENNGTHVISRTSYEGASYTHQGRVLNPNKDEHLVLDDEYERGQCRGPRTRTASRSFPSGTSATWTTPSIRAAISRQWAPSTTATTSGTA
ncbi:hypothetical protein VUR80DRAFT_6339 [Thermomyces stellatus]